MVVEISLVYSPMPRLIMCPRSLSCPASQPMTLEVYGSRPAPSLRHPDDFIETLNKHRDLSQASRVSFRIKLSVSSLQESRNSVLSLVLVLPSTVQERMLAPGPSGEALLRYSKQRSSKRCVKSNIFIQMHPVQMGCGSCWFSPPL